MAHDQLKTAKTHSRQPEPPEASDRLAGEGLQKRLHFELLLSDLSARFIDIASDQVDLEIENALRKILEFFQVDHCGLVRISAKDKSFRFTHVAYASDIPTLPENMDHSINLFPWVYK